MNIKKSKYYIFFCLLCVCSFGTPGQSKKKLYLEKSFDKNETAASVDTIKITSDEFYLSYEYGPAFVKREKDSKLSHINYMINEKLLALDGYSRHIDTSAEISSLINEYRGDLASEELFKNEILPDVKVTDSEIERVISYKQTEIETKWIFAKDEEGMNGILSALKKGAGFDSLFAIQINDSVYLDERSLKTNLYQLENKNPMLAGIIDSMKAGEITLPIHVDEGWYIVKVVDIHPDLITTESEYTKLKQEASNAVFKKKMDILSDNYVNELMAKNNPVIKREPFNFVRSYLGKFYLSEEQYEDWQLEQKLNQALANIQNGINNSILVELETRSISVQDFLIWFRNRSQYIKFNKADLENFSVSLEKMIWRMVRDKLLAETAIEKGYGNSEEVLKQLSWWKDKIVGSAVRNEIANSVVLSSEEVNKNSGKEVDAEELNGAFHKKLLHKILALKQKYKVVINENVIESVKVSTENDPKAIEFYAVKKGGLIPRTPYPTINHEWVNWE